MRFLYFVDLLDPWVNDPAEEIPVTDDENTLTMHLLRTGDALRGPSAELRIQHGIPFGESSGPDSADWLGVPMRRGSHVVGAVVVQNYEKRDVYSDEDRALLAYVAQHIMTVDDMPGDDELTRFCALSNAVASGLTLSHAAERIRSRATSVSGSLTDGLCRTLEDLATDERAGELYMAGTSRLAHQPNASDLAPLLDALEEQVVLMRLMNTLSEEDTDTGVGVAIGSETGTPGLIHASVVTSGYGRTADDGEDGETSAHHQSLAFVGSIGPTHMNYMTTISAVRAVARYLTALITPQEHPQ